VFNTFKNFVQEATFLLNDEGIQAEIMDKSKVTVTSIKMKRNVFDVIEFSKIFKESGEKLKMTIELEKIYNILKTLKKDSTLEIEATDRTLKMTMDGKREFETTALVDLEEEKIPDISNFNGKAKVEMRTKMLCDAITDAAIVSGAMTFKTDGKEFLLETRGEKGESTRSKLGPEHEVIVEGEDQTSRYPNEYLTKAMVLFRMFETIKIDFNSDEPARFKMDNEGYEAQFLVAPRVAD